MTVLLVLFTLILFLVADHFVQQRRVRGLVVARQTQGFRMPEGVKLALNHTWSRDDGRGNATLGLDELMGRLVGTIDEIVLPPLDSFVTPATAAFSVRQGGKTLTFAPPVSGRVVEVNHHIAKNPDLAQGQPYEDGWLVRVRPAKTTKGSVMSGDAAREWLQRQADLVKEFLSERAPHAGLAFMQDGGLPAAGALSGFDERVWKEFQQRFASLVCPGSHDEVPS